ncbi:MAG: hypothetical protein KY397_06085 [Gemmatimonadetes bacterium]|nr:hypothetical protein [Gemmatimonadota bacterium]
MKFGKIVLATALVVVGLGMYAGYSWTTRIDPERIYANGMSKGDGMAFALSCALSDRIATVSLVARAQALPLDWCTDTRPLLGAAVVLCTDDAPAPSKRTVPEVLSFILTRTHNEI